MLHQKQKGLPNFEFGKPSTNGLNHTHDSREPMCPRCGSGVEIIDYDYGPDPDTGYRDTGERYHCLSLNCGAGGDAENVIEVDLREELAEMRLYDMLDKIAAYDAECEEEAVCQ